MLIDLIFFVLMITAVFKGISKGFIVAIFSLIAFIIGLAAALKLSATVAKYLSSQMNISSFILPVLSFIIVFALVVWIVRWGAALIKKAVSVAFLGWIDAIAGILLYAIMYIMIFSVMLFFATRIHLITEEAKVASKTYSFIEPFGPGVMTFLGKMLPFFSHMFSDLSHFFENVSKKSA